MARRSRARRRAGNGMLPWLILLTALTAAIAALLLTDLLREKHTVPPPLPAGDVPGAVEEILPDYKARRKWLKDHGAEIMARII